MHAVTHGLCSNPNTPKLPNINSLNSIIAGSDQCAHGIWPRAALFLALLVSCASSSRLAEALMVWPTEGEETALHVQATCDSQRIILSASFSLCSQPWLSCSRAWQLCSRYFSLCSVCLHPDFWLVSVRFPLLKFIMVYWILCHVLRYSLLCDYLNNLFFKHLYNLLNLFVGCVCVHACARVRMPGCENVSTHYLRGFADRALLHSLTQNHAPSKRKKLCVKQEKE